MHFSSRKCLHWRRASSTLLEPQSRLGDKPLKLQVVCPPNGTEVLNGLTHHLLEVYTKVAAPPFPPPAPMQYGPQKKKNSGTVGGTPPRNTPPYECTTLTGNMSAVWALIWISSVSCSIPGQNGAVYRPTNKKCPDETMRT